MAHFINQLDGSAIVAMATSINRQVVLRDKNKAAYEAYINADNQIQTLKAPYEQMVLKGMDLFKVAPVTKVPCEAKRADGTVYESYKTQIKLNPLGYDDQGRFDLDLLKQRLAEQDNGTAVNTASHTVTAEPVLNPNVGTVPTDVESDTRTAEPVDATAPAAPAENNNTADGVVSASGTTAATAADVDPFESL